MKKNLKVLSSLALAGMLTTGVMGTSSAAITTKDVTSTVPGIYSNTVVSSIKNVVPIMLDNAKDIATMKDIIDSGLFDKTAFQGFDENKQFRSGDTFKLKGKEYTVLIMGDADRNGIVDINDALEIAKYKRNLEGNKLKDNEIALASGDVRRAAGQGADINDALRIQQFVLGQLKTKGENIVDKLPDADAVEEYPYTLTVEGGYLNNQNAVTGKTATVNIGLTPSDTEIKGLTVKVLDSEGNAINTLSKSVSSIAAHVDLHPVTGFNFSNAKTTPDGTYTFQLLDKDNKVVGETTVEKNTEMPTAAKVVAKRLNTREATLSLEGYGTELKKVYYATKQIDTIDDNTKYIDVNGNKLVDASLNLGDLANNTKYDLYYVLENIYGSRTAISTSCLKTIIPKDGDNVKEEKSVTEITVPTLKGRDNKFSWTPDNNMTAGATYTVILYKDNQIIDEVNVGTTTSKDYTTSKMQEAGTYKIGVVVNGASDGTTTVSEEVVSGEVEVKRLQAVSKIDFTIPETGDERILSWEDSNATEEVESYTIQLYAYNQNTKKYDQKVDMDNDGTNNVTVYTTDSEETKAKKIDISDMGFDPNIMYKAEIVVNQKPSQKAVLKSENKLSEGFYELEISSATVESADEESVTLDVSQDTVSGFVPTYKVEVYEAVTETEGLIESVNKYKYVTTKDVTMTKEGKIVVSELEQNKKYGFKLVADVNGIIGKSASVYGITSPTIDGLKKVDTVEEAKVAKTVYYTANGTVAYIDGKEITLKNGSTNLYDQSLYDNLAIITKIHANDIITIEKDIITISLEDSKATSSTVDTIDFGVTTAGKKLVLTGKAKTQRTLKANSGKVADKNPAEVTLQGNEAIFDTKALNADKIILTDGVEVINVDATASKEFTIAANATVIINGVSVKTDKETKIVVGGTATAITLNVKLEEGTTTDNNLTFTNSKGKAAVIGFETIVSGNPANYMGTITIDSTGGSVKVNTQTSVNVKDVKLNVTANNAKVDLSDASQASNTNITTTVTKDVTAGTNETKFVYAAEKTPTKLAIKSGDKLELKEEYTDTEISKFAYDTVTDPLNPAYSTNLTPEQKEEIVEFLDSFGLNGTGAKITAVDPVTKTITIVFTKAGTFTVKGIK